MNYELLFYKKAKDLLLSPEQITEVLSICEHEYRTACEYLDDMYPRRVSKRKDTLGDKIAVGVYYFFAVLFFALIAFIFIATQIAIANGY